MTSIEATPTARNRAKVYQQARTTYDRYAAAISLTLLGPTRDQIQAARMEKALSDVEQLYLDARLLSESVGEVYNVAVVDFQLGLLCRLLGRLDESLNYFRRALLALQCVLKPSAAVHDSISQCHYYIAKALLDRGDSLEARKHLRIAAEIDAATGIRMRESARNTLIERTRPLESC